MSIQTKNINVKTGTFAWDWLDFSLPVAPVASQTNQVFGRLTLTYAYTVIGVRLYGTSFTNLTSVDVGLAPTAGGTFTSVLTAQMTPSNDTEVVGVITGTRATILATATSQLICRYTTGTGPAAVNAYVSVLIRARPMDGEAN